MKSHRKMIICGVFILIMSLSLMAGCGEKHSQEIDVSKTGDTGMISTAELKSIANSGVASLTDDSAASIWWVPKDKKTTLNEVTSWLQQAKPYKGKIPKSQNVGIFKGNIFPSKLYIKTSDEHEVTIQPAFYIAISNGKSSVVNYINNVLQLKNGNQKIYIQSSELFNWLKNDKWKTEFEMKH